MSMRTPCTTNYYKLMTSMTIDDGGAGAPGIASTLPAPPPAATHQG